MLYRLALILEVFAIILCIHRIYNTKLKLDIKTAALGILSLEVSEIVSYFELNNLVTVCIYAFIMGYCILKFHDTFVGALISVLLMLIVISLLQFGFVILANIFFPQNREIRMLVANLLVAICVLWILPVIKLHKLRRIFRKRDTFINTIFCMVLIVVFMITITGKHEKKLNITSFVLAVPMAAALVVLLNKWDMAQEEKERIKNELSVTKNMQAEYDDLLTAVRLREHGFKNHIAALFSMKLSDELEKEQEDYYEGIREANKYNKLLFLGNRVMAGYLYKKFCETEDMGGTVICDIKGCFVNDVIPIYYLIEMLGILIDNAVEAQSDMIGKRKLKFQFDEEESYYWFKVLNPYPYVSYAEMESWFLLGNSRKGKERGLGLYQIKNLCEDYNVDLACRNVVWEERNWIEFSIRIKKADKL